MHPLTSALHKPRLHRKSYVFKNRKYNNIIGELSCFLPSATPASLFFSENRKSTYSRPVQSVLLNFCVCSDYMYLPELHRHPLLSRSTEKKMRKRSAKRGKKGGKCARVGLIVHLFLCV